MRLQQVSTLRTALGADDITDINEALKFTLDSASLALEQEIRSPFAKVTDRDDRFFQDATVYFSDQPRNHFLLKQGFLTGAPSVVIATKWEDLDPAESPEDITSECVVELEKGVVHNYTRDLTNYYVSITYTAGFDPDGSDPDQYDLAQVPKWLQNAAGLWARISLQNHPFFSEAESDTDAKALKGQLVSMILNKVRYVPVARTPIN